MGQTCESCGEVAVSYSIKYITTADGHCTTKTECYSCLHPTHTDLNVAKSIFHGDGLTLEHVTDEFGQPVRVTSLRQLREAEKRYHFRSIVGNEDEANFNRLPPPKPSDPFEVMSREKKWLYPEVAERMLKEMRQNGELIEPRQEKLYHNPYTR